MTVTQVSQKEDGKPTSRRDITTKAPLSERIMKKVATAALVLGMATLPANCTLESNGIQVDSGQADADADLDADTDHDGGPDLDADTDHDSGPDADTDDGGPDLDADTDTDADTDLDGGPDADTDLDSGPDADADTDLDGGPDADADTDLDGGPDADTDADVDAGDADAGPIVCAATFEESISGSPVYVGTPVNVGGYTFDNLGESGSGVLMNIGCVDDGSPLESDVYLEEGAAETVIDRVDEGKRLRLRNLSNSAILANMTIIVENL